MAPNNIFYPRYSRGFTLIELIMVIAILGSLAALAIPSYLSYLQKAYYSEFIDAISPYKAGVDLCYQLTNSLNNCNGGQNGIPNNIMNNNNVSNIRWILTAQGVVYLFPNNNHGFTLLGDYLVLTPQINGSGMLTWRFGGPALTKGYVSNS